MSSRKLILGVFTKINIWGLMRIHRACPIELWSAPIHDGSIVGVLTLDLLHYNTESMSLDDDG